MTDQPRGVRFIEAGACQCRFFLEGQSGMDGFVCGDPARDGNSYCRRHHFIVFKPVPVSQARQHFKDYSIQEVDCDADHEPDLTEILS